MKLRSWYVVWAASDRTVSPMELWDALSPKLNGVVVEAAFTSESWDELQSKLRIEGGNTQPSFDAAEHCVFRVDSSGEKLVQVRWVRDVIAVQREVAELHMWIDNIRDELNKVAVLAHLKQVRQIVSITSLPNSFGITQMARICEQLSGFLACQCQGLIHVESAGIFDRDGNSIFPFNPKHRLNAGTCLK